MGLKQRGNPGAMAAERAKARNWTRHGLVNGKGLVRVLVHSGCFAAVGMGVTNAEAIQDGRNTVWKSQNEFRRKTPDNLGGTQANKLKETTQTHIRKLTPRFTERLKLESVYVQLRDGVNSHFKDGEKVHRFGSVVSGLSLPGGDLDVCLLHNAQPVRLQRQSMIKAFDLMKKIGFGELKPIPGARVPIIKFVHLETGVEGDLGFGSSAGVVNSLLLKAYTDMEPKFRNLTVLVKNWAKQRDIASASKGFLSSYGWTLLVLFYLQRMKVVPTIDVQPALKLLRSPQLAVSERENLQWLSRFFQKFATGSSEASSVPVTDEALVDGFFHFYARKNSLGTNVVSTRTGRFLRTDMSKCYNPRKPAFVHVEDPLLETINVSRHLRNTTIETLLYEIRRAHQTIRLSGDYDEVCQQREVLPYDNEETESDRTRLLVTRSPVQRENVAPHQLNGILAEDEAKDWELQWKE